jgi:colanic acid/amylovoran biosynthesis glycosyltransferase
MNNTKPCVAIFRRTLLPTSETFIANQARHLKQWQPLLLGYNFDKNGVGLVDGLDTSCLSQHSAVPKLKQLLFKVSGKLPRAWLAEIRQHNPRLLHAHFGWSAAPAIAIADALDIPLLTTFHGSDITKNSPRNAYKKQRQRLFNQASPVIAISEFVKKNLIRQGCVAESIRVHYIGIDTNFFCPTTDKKSGRPPTVIFVGNLNEQKGCTDLLLSALELSEKYPEWHFHIIGNGVLRESLEKLAEPLGQRCKFFGTLKPVDVSAALQNADVACVPSRQMVSGTEEGLSMACAEASSTGLPVVAYNSGGIGEVVIHDSTGLLAEKNNQPSLTRCLDQMLSSAEQRHLFGQNGRLFMKKQFNIQTQCSKLEEIYSMLVKQ